MGRIEPRRQKEIEIDKTRTDGLKHRGTEKFLSTTATPVVDSKCSLCWMNEEAPVLTVVWSVGGGICWFDKVVRAFAQRRHNSGVTLSYLHANHSCCSVFYKQGTETSSDEGERSLSNGIQLQIRLVGIHSMDR